MREDVPEVELRIRDERRRLDLDAPTLPDWVTEPGLSAGGYPYDEKLSKKRYKRTLEALQVELVKLQYWQERTGERIVCLFEGRDAAGKGGSIARVREYLNPRRARIVALPKPSDAERGQWYFQRYAAHLPTTGEMVLFDRSWYNRAGVERVMGFTDDAAVERFMDEAPRFEAALVRSGIRLHKFWLAIAQEEQIERFHDRRHDPLKTWKLSSMDVAAMTKWDAYTQARDAMFEATHTDCAPWTVVRANDKRRARIEVIRTILSNADYDDKDEGAIGDPDPKIVGGPSLVQGD
ncbi:polyphosphate kinase 2 [Parvularcula dongshanensis]|uniref:ADP/GDP-polyphosphate phosphotransferase n=1 Tax=Parvularcula dongshanensis TaxID=1173995 RepID=A0A840I3I3_9PROT|nr:polyphosphate kinase 2 [Parvularcula dongshanensis]